MLKPRPPLLRFAPSPTGSLHLGGLRTALLNHLFARKHGGKWILRIEDTDSSRQVRGSVDEIVRSLEWANLHYDYGPGAGGPHAPYFQSERLDLYHQYTNKLVERGHAYRCFCSVSELSNIRAKLTGRRSNQTYDKRCLHLSEDEVARRVKAGHKYSVRLNDGSIPTRSNPPDLIFGAVKDAHSSLPTDPILLKSDRFPTYHLASVVDDHEMGITHVFRGEEWLPSVPLHLDLYACLDIPAPQFAHLPLLLNKDGSKMSKRHGDVSVRDYIEAGWLAPAVLNWLALTGWGASSEAKGPHEGDALGDQKARNKFVPDRTEMFTLDELTEKFDVTALTPRRTMLDIKKLEGINKKHLQSMIDSDEGIEVLAAETRKSMEEAHPRFIEKINEFDFKEIIRLAKDRLKNSKELPKMLEFLLWESGTHPAISDFLVEGRIDPTRFHDVTLKYENLIADAIKRNEPWDESTISNIEAKRESKDEMPILRIALTAEKTGLPLAIVMFLLGPAETMKRLESARIRNSGGEKAKL